MISVQDGNRVLEKDIDPMNLGFYTHAKEMTKALTQIGVRFRDDAKIVLHQYPSYYVQRVPEKINILYTAYEAEDLPDSYAKPAASMDAIICVSDFVAKAFKKRIKGIPIYTCPLGVDVKTFVYVKRKMPDRMPFVILWVGSPNKRKGWEIIQSAWESFAHDPNYMLYIKTTGRGKIEYSQNVIVDSRFLKRKQLAEIYHSANAFLFPSLAEGFGLPLAEAMATGLPCIYTPYSGVNQFAGRKYGFPVRFSLHKVKYETMTKGALAKTDSVVENIITVRRDYKAALRKGKRAASRIRNKFTWGHSAKKMLDIIREVSKNGQLDR